MSAKVPVPRGFRDILGAEARRFSAFESLSRRLFAVHGYEEIRVPTLEFKSLFDKSSGETSDVVEKEMFSFPDSKGRDLALRPEGTPGVVRAFLGAGGAQDPKLARLFYIASMFRAERPQAGRYREFEQIGAEWIGNPHPNADADLIVLLDRLLAEAGVSERELELSTLGCSNCRPAFREALRSFLADRSDLCEDCVRRVERNPLRALDCKIDGPKLAGEGPKLEPCAECVEHFEAVQGFLGEEKIPFRVDTGLVRGLDYYTRTVFEFKAAITEDRRDTIAAGGRYDELVKTMGGPPTPAVGWALGVERTLMATGTGPSEDEPAVVVIAPSKDSAVQRGAFSLLSKIRAAGLRATAANWGASLKSQMRAADGSGARAVVLLGDAEWAKSVAAVKDLSDGGQQVEVPLAGVAEEIRRRLKA